MIKINFQTNPKHMNALVKAIDGGDKCEFTNGKTHEGIEVRMVKTWAEDATLKIWELKNQGSVSYVSNLRDLVYKITHNCAGRGLSWECPDAVLE